MNIQPISGKPKVGTDGITLKCKMVKSGRHRESEFNLYDNS